VYTRFNTSDGVAGLSFSDNFEAGLGLPIGSCPSTVIDWSQFECESQNMCDHGANLLSVKALVALDVLY
jgi:hypothetical protein